MTLDLNSLNHATKYKLQMFINLLPQHFTCLSLRQLRATDAVPGILLIFQKETERHFQQYKDKISLGIFREHQGHMRTQFFQYYPPLLNPPIPLSKPHSVCCLGALMLHCPVLRAHWASLCITPHYTPQYLLCSLCAHVCMSEKQRIKRHNCACMCKLCVSIWIQERKMLCVYNAYVICACVYAFSGSACVNQS